MRFRATFVRAAVATLPLAVGACDGGSSTTASNDGKSKTDAKDPKADPKVDPNVDSKGDPKVDAKVGPPKPDKPFELPDIFVRTPDEIPTVMAGAIAPYEPPEVTPPSTPKAKSDSPASGSAAPHAAMAPSAMAPAAEASAAAPEPSPAVKIAHNHPPGAPCGTPSRADVEKALADLKK
jgi:hypothetical protein